MITELFLQIIALAEAGFHVIAPDQRGYGESECLPSIESYTIFHLVGDVIALIDLMQEKTAVVIGHDWGSNVAWHTALFRPDRVRAVGSLSVPFTPRSSEGSGYMRMRKAAGDRFYQHYFQVPGVAEKDFERDLVTSFRKFLFAGSGDAPTIFNGVVPEVGCGRGGPQTRERNRAK